VRSSSTELVDSSQSTIASHSDDAGTLGSGCPSRQVGAESTIRAPCGSSPTAATISSRAAAARDSGVPASSTSSRGSPVTMIRSRGIPNALAMRGATAREATGNTLIPRPANR